ncbi:MAG: LysM peptidoglycan-binding domain-containing protein [Planctomycetes bacterium]|nr:LysM peptidoglycan-binding domain-containing protein [Planctomycetota bacterium]
MIRLALGIGTLAIMLAMGVLIYRWVHTPDGTQTAESLPGEAPVEAGLPPPNPAPPADSTMPSVPVGPLGEAQPVGVAPAVPAPSPLPPLPNEPVAPAPTQTAQAPAAPTGALPTHRVQSGDSLWKICMRYYGNAKYVNQIAQANGLESAGSIKPGQVLVLPNLANIKPAPVDADHEVAEEPAARRVAPVQPQSPAASEFVPMPPTLNATAPREARESR